MIPFPSKGRRRVGFASVLTVAGAMSLAACGLRSGAEPPGPGWERGGVPELRGARVLLLPVQRADRPAEEVDLELAHAMRQRGTAMEWTDAATLKEIAEAAGAMGADPARLAVAVFRAGEVRQIGDPLFGDIYRLAALVDANVVVLPLAAYGEPDEVPDRESVILEAVLLDARTGRVLWQGILQGAPGAKNSPAPLASVADRLAARLVR